MINNELIDNTIEDLSYLKDELILLEKYLKEVPYDEKPGDLPSIHQLLELIATYQRELLKSLKTTLDNQEFHPFVPIKDISDLIKEIIDIRTHIVTILKNLSPEKWGNEIEYKGLRIQLIDAATNQVSSDRFLLKKAAEMILNLNTSDV